MSSSINSDSSANAGAQIERKRRDLNFSQRIEVIDSYRKTGNKSLRQLANELGCDKTQIFHILTRSETYLREWREKEEGKLLQHFRSRKRRARRTGNEETNRLVFEWYCA